MPKISLHIQQRPSFYLTKAIAALLISYITKIMISSDYLPKLEQLCPLIKWQLLNIPGSVEQLTIVGLTHHPYLLSSIEQQTLLTFSQEDHVYYCHLPSGLKITSSKHANSLYVFSFSLDKQFVRQQYICPF